MNQSSVFSSGRSSGLNSSVDFDTFSKFMNKKLRTGTSRYTEQNRSEFGRQDNCFSAARLKQYVEFKKWSEQQRYIDLIGNDDWMNQKEIEYLRHNRMIKKYLSYLLLSTRLEMQSKERLRIYEMEKKKREIAQKIHVAKLQEAHTQNRKRRLCRHFLKGYCKRGKSCDFLHDSSIFCADLQKVFLGGLPSNITELSLRQKMEAQGYHVINKPKVLRGFAPQVCLGSTEEAQELIKKGKITIDGSFVDVRPYEEFVKDAPVNDVPDEIKRSVFLGGLPNGITGKVIKQELQKLNLKVVNFPIIKSGFSPQVILATVEQAKKLVSLKKINISNAVVDIRPYENCRVESDRFRE